MSNKIEELINSCEELVILLQKNGNDNWAQWFNAALASLRQDDLYGCRKILNAYGGMGSFNRSGFVPTAPIKTIGAYMPSDTSFLAKGEIAVILIYHSASVNVATVEAYFTTKWGV
jgi:hypothetical protein